LESGVTRSFFEGIASETHTHTRARARTRAHTRTHARTHTHAHARARAHTHTYLEWTHMANLRVYKGVQLKSKLKHAGTWSAAAHPPRRLCYRPTVFVRHFRSDCAFFPARKNLARFSIFLFTFCLNRLSLRLLSWGVSVRQTNKRYSLNETIFV